MSDETQPLARGLVLRKVVRGSVEIGVVLGPARFTEDAVDVLIGWVTDPGVAGIATLRFAKIERGIWRVASEQDAATARTNLAVPEQDRLGRDLWSVDAVVLTEPLGSALSPPIAQPWSEEAQRIVDAETDRARACTCGMLVGPESEPHVCGSIVGPFFEDLWGSKVAPGTVLHTTTGGRGVVAALTEKR